jgi:23S rRNA (uracil1939-C5)-methyltransferase
MKVELEIDIEQIGARGDGIATLEDGRRLYVPFTVPGDRVRARLGKPRPDGFAASAQALLAEGPGRGTPLCRHFGRCGGCALQHLSAEHYRRWKLDLLGEALARQGVVAGAIRDLKVARAGGRRRAEFSAVRRKHDVVLGLNARLSHQVIDLAECPVLLPAIVALTAPLRELLFALLDPADSAEVAILMSDSGLDLLLVTGAQLGLKRRETLATFAEAHDLARIARRHPHARGTETILERRPVRMRFGDVAVAIPPGAFLQASAEGELALCQAVEEGVGAVSRIADLYSGCGTFALPLAAAGRTVHAVEGDEHMVEALQAAVRTTARLRVTAVRRDLDRRPLAPDELRHFDAVVFDPPRAGAGTQAEMLARSGVKQVVAVSCNPATFARDARTLVDGGFGLDWIQPVDQFLWSPHLELVAAFSRN